MLIQKLKSRNIILASRSPRRKELLSALGLSFRVVIPGVSENYPVDLEREEVAIYLAERKAASVIDQERSGSGSLLVIASDTIVCKANEIFNKPADRDGAIKMLQELSGNKHSVITAVCIANTERMKSFYSETQVYFTKLQDEEINYYVDNYKPYDKAGSYGIQEWIGYIGIEKIEGSYFNVMGLPVQKLYRELKNFIK
ncbi:MAG: Maf family nucleotide pyrophosphatase [Bacteroidales bacterium]|nr:Maf family nucleotide pyrophosphatase [Bacteroidales bacterium]